jgi:hypothetical protein
LVDAASDVGKRKLKPDPANLNPAQVARLLGLPRAAALPKRAIQFGSRIAKQSNTREFGSNRKANSASAGSAKFRD